MLTAKKRVFIEEYLKTGGEGRWNATRAAQIAGYKYPRQEGHRLLSNADIQAAIEERMAELKMSATEVLVRQTEIARFDPLKYADFNDLGYVVINLVLLREAGLGHLVKKIYYDKWGNQCVEFHDSMRAQENLGKHHKIFTDSLKLEADTTLQKWLEKLTSDE